MSSINTETETVVKKILPYLQRRGYDILNDLDYETSAERIDRYSKGYIDILVKAGRTKPVFLIEAKKISKKLTTKDRDQAISYASSPGVNVPFVVVTNGNEIQCFNSCNKQPIMWDNASQLGKIPTKEQLKIVVRLLKSNPNETRIALSNDTSLPFRPGLALRQLNALFQKCHGAIRKIEKNEEHAFADFSKLLFLKLLEEKEDVDFAFQLPYSYRFHELARKPSSEADQVKDSILSMVSSIVSRTAFGAVLEDKIKLKNPKTFHYIVKELAAVSFYDCSLDSKGAAFEYFVRATLKGKKLGQYFTPREVVQTMLSIVGRRKIVRSVLSGEPVKVLDPACGTGGFLVFLMQDSLAQLDSMFHAREITRASYEKAQKTIKENVFFGSDANEGVAASAKMNMIIAGDGHTNIQHEDSLSISARNWSAVTSDCDLILTNPPFGTSEKLSLTSADWEQFEIKSAKGQHLFLQKMVLAAKHGGGEICTVIDEGVLNTDTAAEIRKWIMSHCRLRAVLSLPTETFKPNKINVKSSLLYFERRKEPDHDFEDVYNVVVCRIESLGYQGSGDRIRGFNLDRLLNEISDQVLSGDCKGNRAGYNWEAFDVLSSSIVEDPTFRFDFKYWDKETRSKIESIRANGGKTILELNLVKTVRGKSPSVDCYVDMSDGFAVVIKAGSNINKQGKVDISGADWIEKSVYDEYLAQAQKPGVNSSIIEKMDVLLSSTGDGTLGKACVYDLEIPAVADGHVTIIRCNGDLVDPY